MPRQAEERDVPIPYSSDKKDVFATRGLQRPQATFTHNRRSWSLIICHWAAADPHEVTRRCSYCFRLNSLPYRATSVYA